MRYFTVSADYRGSGIQDDFQGPIPLDDLGLPDTLIRQIAKWVSDYQPIILLDKDQRADRREKIEELDQTGLGIARAFKDHFGDTAKVQYYSEGKLRRIPV